MRVVVAVLALCAIGLWPSAGIAQTEGPRANTIAVGGDVGFLAPDNGESDATRALQVASGNVDAFAEYYYTPRTSLRAMYGWSSPEFESSTRSLRRRHVTLNFIYNWSLGRVRPFATVGGGAYFIDVRDSRNSIGSGMTKPGGNLGAGAEYYFRTFAVRSEMNVHILGREKTLPELNANTLTAFTWTFGIKVPF